MQATAGSVPAASKLLLSTITLDNPGINETIRRTRGVFGIESDQNSALEFNLGAMGMVVVSETAIAAGVASIPGPVTDASDDGWFVWEPFTQETQGVTGGSKSTGYTFDSKAMRRIEEGFAVAVVVENAHATHAFEITMASSTLTSRS